MHLWMLTLLCATVYGISRISQSELKAVNFAKAIPGYKLNERVFKEIEVNSERSCQFECVGEEKCLSYNFGPTNGTSTAKKNSKRFMCQLSNSDRFVGFANFAEDREFIYKGRQTACETDSSLCGDKEICIPNYQDDTVQCKCNDGFIGTPCKRIKSCSKLIKLGFTFSGVYTINPDGGKPIQVLCDMTTDGGGWTVFQRRLDGSVDFYLDWESYKNGFGDLKGEFWLGNDNLHGLTAGDDVILRVDLEDFNGDTRYAEYTTFKVADKADNYRLLIGGYSGTAGDSMTLHNGMQFSTKDNDNDHKAYSCSKRYKGAWWYEACHNSNLNGLYLNGSHSSYADGVEWGSFRGYYYSLKRTEMKVKTKF